MHFSIPDTVELKDKGGSAYLAYNVCINGAFHAAVRFSDLYNFNDQLKKNFGGKIIATFPPRKILSLTPIQIEERREQLEKYLQDVCQDVDVTYSEIFSSFLRNCQKEYYNALTETVSLDIYLMNGQKISLKIVATDSTDDVLEAAMSEINLSDELVHYFALFLIKREEDGGASIERRLQDYESPYLSIKNLQGTYRIAVRKSFWDSKIEDKILEDKIGINLLYVQAVSDIERGWVVGPKEAYSRLAELKQNESKKEYLRLARMMKYYGFLQFKPCITNYPEDNTRVLVSCGDRELNFRLQTADHKVQEGSFKVTRMRCWRITSSNISNEDDTKTDEHLELAFEYLLGKDNLHWISVYSDQAILISMCLQSIVDEILRLKQGKPVKSVKKKNTKKRGDRYERCNSISSTASNEGEENKPPNSNGISNENTASSPSPSLTTKKKSQKPATQNYLPVPQNQVPPSKSTKTNEVFEGIGDDDL